MLKKLGGLVLLLAIAAVAFVAYAATKPDSFVIERSVSIKAPPEKIFPLINDLHQLNTWNPFAKKDPSIALTYSGPESGKGSTYDFVGNSEVGKGRLSITDASPPAKVTMALDMLEPMEAHHTVEFSLKPQGEMTTVNWAMQGQSPLIAKVMDTIFNMDSMVGGEFEKGLADLKALAEK